VAREARGTASAELGVAPDAPDADGDGLTGGAVVLAPGSGTFFDSQAAASESNAVTKNRQRRGIGTSGGYHTTAARSRDCGLVRAIRAFGSSVLSGVAARTCVLALALAGCAASRGMSDASAAASPSGVRYLALGDSFTIGTGSSPAESFPARLTKRWTCPVELANAGVNGFTSDDVIEVELPRLESFRPTMVTLLVGANDIVQHVSAEAYRAHVRSIFRAIQARGVARVVALPQPDWSLSPVASAFGSPAELHAEIVSFNRILSEETALAHAEYVDLFPLMESEASAKMLAADGLHPSAVAYDAWAEELTQRVSSPCAE
jgi:acyl-CoA thioesterase-1